MLKIIKTTKAKYDELSLNEKNTPETMYLITDEKTNLSSIYVNDMCYGENIDEESINENLENIKQDLSALKIADNFDILKMFE